MLTKKNKILARWFYAASALFLGGAACACFPQVLGGNPIVRFAGIIAVIAGYAGFIGVGWARTRITKRWIAEHKSENDRLMEQALYAPAVSKYNRSDSIVTVTWSTDYKAGLKIYVSMIVYSPGTFIGGAIVGAFAAMIAAASLGTFDWTAICAAFLLGIVVVYLLAIARASRTLGPSYPSKTAKYHVALALDPGGIREITGQIERSFEWAKVRRIWRVLGHVGIIRSEAFRLIPKWAFHSRQDIQVFIVLANALKSGKTPPAYDWSSYDALEDDGVWPPPPSP